jgi:predicted ATPase
MSLYNMSKDNSADDMLFYIVDQIKHGFANLFNESLELRMNIAKLFESSGSKAAASSDHVASCSYFTYALSLLPPDHWKSHYDLSVQFSLRLAKSCYSCGDLEKAQLILQEMTFQCHSIEDKAPAHALLAKSEYNIVLG